MSNIIAALEQFWQAHPGVKSAVRALAIAVIGAVLHELGLGDLIVGSAESVAP